jgi:hypothetical protein
MEGDAKRHKTDDDVWWLMHPSNCDVSRQRQRFLDAIAKGEDMSRTKLFDVEYVHFTASAMSRCMLLGFNDILERLLDECGLDPNGVCYRSSSVEYRSIDYASICVRSPNAIRIVLRYGGDTLNTPSAFGSADRELIASFQHHSDSVCAAAWVMRAIPGAIWRDLADDVVDRMKKLDF